VADSGLAESDLGIPATNRGVGGGEKLKEVRDVETGGRSRELTGAHAAYSYAEKGKRFKGKEWGEETALGDREKGNEGDNEGLGGP